MDHVFVIAPRSPPSPLASYQNSVPRGVAWFPSGLSLLLLSLQNDANCDCYQTGDGYAKDARLNCPSSLVVSPDGTLYVADLGNIRIRAVRRNQPPTGTET